MEELKNKKTVNIPSARYFIKAKFPISLQHNLMNIIMAIIDVGGRRKLLTSEIVLLQADINYTLLHLSDGEKIIVSYHLGKLQERLSEHKSFVRPNRQTIVNLQFLKKYNDEFLTILNHKVQMSRRRKELILSNLKNTVDFYPKIKKLPNRLPL